MATSTSSARWDVRDLNISSAFSLGSVGYVKSSRRIRPPRLVADEDGITEPRVLNDRDYQRVSILYKEMRQALFPRSRLSGVAQTLSGARRPGNSRTKSAEDSFEGNPAHYPAMVQAMDEGVGKIIGDKLRILNIESEDTSGLLV
ncbi:MAG: hypothetical protein IPK78_07855 [Rhodospirillales bacterium]|nr:hypothetical protein [Rhodospirillales bacterium]